MSWRKVKLGDIVENFSVRAKDSGGAEDLDFFGVSNDFGIIKTKYAAEEKAEDYKIIEKGCFAYNPYRINVGSIGFVREEMKGLISPAYVVFKPKHNSIIPELLLQFLKSFEGLRQIKFHARGTVRQALRFDDLCNIELFIPDYSEQIRFYKSLNLLQEKTKVVDKELNIQLSLVKQLRQSFLQEAMQGKLSTAGATDLINEKELQKKYGKLWNASGTALLAHIKAEKEKLGKGKKTEVLPIKDEEIPFEIPEDWVWCRLGEISENVEYGTSQKAEMSNDHIPVLRMNNIVDGKVDFSKLKYVEKTIDDLPKLFLKKGDLLFNRTNSYELVGKAGVYKGEDNEMTFASYLITQI